MAITNKYQRGMTSGIPGDVFRDGPWRAEAQPVVSSTANNKYGYAYTYTTGGVVAGGAGVFCGVLVRPLSTAIEGTHQKGRVGELATFGQIYVAVKTTDATAPAIGGKVYYSVATGQIQTGATGGAQIQGACISSAVPSAAADGVSLAVITLNGPYVHPVQ